jgi:hypothetical protein
MTPADHIVRQCHMYVALDVGFACGSRVKVQLSLKVDTDAVRQMVRKVFKV